MSGAPTTSAPALAVRPKRWSRAGLSRRDLVALGVLVLIPLLLYVPTAIAGSPVIPGDDLTQNEPLRLLAGELIRSGRLPGWDPLIWSGTPLLAGWNAGAMFPTTWLFAVLPAIAAWTINLLAVPVVAGVGTYAFLRLQRCGPLASLLGALLFTYTGFMNGQIVHIGLTEGTALTPWALLALELLPRARRRADLLGAIALGGAALGLIVLAGDPRAVSSAIVILAIDFLALVWRHPRLWQRLVAGTIAGGVLAVLCSAVQWLPGLAFLHASQRSGSNFSFYASGSLGVRTIGREMILPFLTGGNGNLGQPIYTGNYNLPELTIGVGLVALVAGLAYLPALFRDARRAVRHQPPDAGRDPLARIYALIVLGLLLTLGGDTPLGHVFAEIPLFGSERLQNRNAIVFDLALVWLTALFVEDRAAPLLGSPGQARTTRWVRALSSIAPLATAALIIAGLLSPSALLQGLGAVETPASIVRQMWPYLAGTLLLALALGAFALSAHRCSRRTRSVLLTCFVLADVLTYLVNIGDLTAPSIDLAARNPLSDQLAAATGPDGRFAIVNPAFAQGGSSPNTVNELGVTDLNIVHNLPSVQGYGSIVNGVYQTFTGTHFYEALSARAITGESANTLDLSTLLTLPTYLDEVVPPKAGIPMAMPADATHSSAWTSAGPNSIPPLPYSAGPWYLGPGKTVYFTLATPTALRTVTTLLDPDGPSYPSSLHVETLYNDVRRGSGTAVGHAGRIATHVAGPPVNFIAITNPTRTPAEIGAVVVTTAAPAERLLLDGALEGALSPVHWRYASTIAAFSVFSNPKTLGFSWLQPASTRTPNTGKATSGTVQVLSNSAIAPQVLSIDATHPSELVRSEGYAPGWTANLTPVGGGRTLTLGVHRFGLVQAVSVPSGRYVVRFHYAPTTMFIGFVLSAVGALLLLLILLAMGIRRLRSVLPR